MEPVGIGESINLPHNHVGIGKIGAVFKAFMFELELSRAWTSEELVLAKETQRCLTTCLWLLQPHIVSRSGDGDTFRGGHHASSRP